MRQYAVVAPQFWTGETGRRLRKDRDAQLLALYLITCPSAHMTGLYYLPIPTMCHETGSPFKGALKTLRSLSEGGFCHYDEASETVWVPEMARFQIGETVKVDDLKRKGIENHLKSLCKSKYYNAFIEKYGVAYNLDIEKITSPFEAPSKPLQRGIPLEQEQEQEQEQDLCKPPKIIEAPIESFRKVFGEIIETDNDDYQFWIDHDAYDNGDEKKKMEGWILSNPDKVKNRKNWKRFIINWLNRSIEDYKNKQCSKQSNAGDEYGKSTN